ncbi:helix-turn-helix domain-containing protein [Nocardia rhamnosiphila]
MTSHHDRPSHIPPGEEATELPPLKTFAQQRGLDDYAKFRREFDRVARQIDRNASGHVPSIQTFRQWMSGQAVAPRDGFRRQVLQAMFPGQTTEQLFPGGRDHLPVAGRQAEQGWEPSNPQELGGLLRNLRDSAGVSQRELAEECLLDRSLVAKVEAGQRTLSRRFWAEADIALAAEGSLVDAYDKLAQQQNAPRPGVRVLARRPVTRQPCPDQRAQSNEPSGHDPERISALMAWVDNNSPVKERDVHPAHLQERYGYSRSRGVERNR